MPPTPTSCKTLALAPPETVGLSPQRCQHLMKALQDEVLRKRLPGAVVLLARRGKVALLEQVGVQNPDVAPEHAMVMAQDTIFRIYSMSKPITSVAALMLMEQGRLLLSDPVANYLPEFSSQHVATEIDGHWQAQPVRQAATVQDLLRHTAGLTYEFMGSNAVHRQYAQARIGQRSQSNAEFSQTLAALPLLLQPGTAWEYGRATDVLGRVIEVVSGQTLGEHLHQHIFAPLGMVDTAFSVPAHKHARLAYPFVRDPEGGLQMRMIDVREKVALQSGGGGLTSTAMDYARFLQCLLGGGELDGVRLLSPKTVAYMTADHLGPIPINTGTSCSLLGPGYGFGLGVAVRRCLGESAVPGSVGSYYWGGLAGTTFFVDPAEDMFAILMLQAPNQREYYRRLFRNLVYAAVVD